MMMPRVAQASSSINGKNLINLVDFKRPFQNHEHPTVIQKYQWKATVATDLIDLTDDQPDTQCSESPSSDELDQLQDFLKEICEVGGDYIVCEQLRREVQDALALDLPNSAILCALQQAFGEPDLRISTIGPQTAGSPSIHVYRDVHFKPTYERSLINRAPVGQLPIIEVCWSDLNSILDLVQRLREAGLDRHPACVIRPPIGYVRLVEPLLNYQALARSLTQRHTCVYYQEIRPHTLSPRISTIYQRPTNKPAASYFQSYGNDSTTHAETPLQENSTVRYYIPHAKYSLFHQHLVPFNIFKLTSDLNQMADRILPGIHHSRLMCNATGISSAFGTEPAGLLSIHYHWSGAEQEWIFASKHEGEHLIVSTLRALAESDGHGCSYAYSHWNYNLPRDILKNSPSHIYTHRLKRGEFLITFDQALGTNYSLGPNIIESTRFTDRRWRAKYQGLSYEPPCTCPNTPHRNLNWQWW